MFLSIPQSTPNSLQSVLLISGIGFVLGMRHSTDADHLVALSTIVSKQRSIKRAAWIGSMWGVGHTITIFAVGVLIILFDVHIPPRLGLAMEFSVAVMLIVLGLLNLTGVMQKATNYFSRAGTIPAQKTVTAGSSTNLQLMPKLVEQVGWYSLLRPLAIGLVHGLAGSAAVALLVLSTIQSRLWAVVYLLVFGAGTVVGMMLMTTAIAFPLTYGGSRFAKLGHSLAITSGVVSLCFGSFLVYKLGFVGGLFSRHPHWVPQ